ncbi:MAG: hypothetical protein NC336_10325 [Clostridium sp.]|nr:hypothetical protein [Clostridium sp.]
MKHFYTLLLAAAVALTAGAQKSTLATAQLPLQAKTGMTARTLALPTASKIQKAKAHKAPVLAPDGLYLWSGYSALTNGSPFGEIELKDYDSATGEATLSLAGFELPCTIDLTAGTLSIEKGIWLGEDSDGDIIFYVKGVDAEDNIISGATDAVATVGTIDDNGTITFPPFDIWALGDPENEAAGWYFMTYVNVFEIENDSSDPNEGWTTIGNAEFVDPWVTPAFDINQEEIPWEVELQQNDADKDTYRLVAPYQNENCPFVTANEATKTGYIQFNISNPDYVYFDIVEAGFANSQAGISKFYCYNTLSWFMGGYGLSAEEIIDAYGEEAETAFNTKFVDGMVVLGETEYTTNDGTLATGWDAIFGIQGEVYGAYGWNDADMGGYIKFPDTAAIGSITASEENAPVKYYNMQGVEIAKPQAGQLVVRVQGQKADKIIVR